MPYQIAIAICFLSIGVSAGAQAMYRCGNTYSDRQCGPTAEQLKTSTGEHPIVRLLDIPATPVVEAKAKAICKESLINLMKDPDSAKIGEVTRGALDHVRNDQTGKVLVVRRYNVMINAKNSYGGYTGQKRYGCSFNYDETLLTWAGIAE